MLILIGAGARLSKGYNQGRIMPYTEKTVYALDTMHYSTVQSTDYSKEYRLQYIRHTE